MMARRSPAPGVPHVLRTGRMGRRQQQPELRNLLGKQGVPSSLAVSLFAQIQATSYSYGGGGALKIECLTMETVAIIDQC